MNKQPVYFQCNEEQNVFIAASDEDCVYVNLTKNIEIDIDKKFAISVIRQLTYDEEDKVFFILANKVGELSPKLGFYVVKMNCENPEQCEFMIKWKNKLDIGDAHI